MEVKVEEREADEKSTDDAIPDPVFSYMNDEELARVSQFRQPEELQPVQSIECNIDDVASQQQQQPQQQSADRVPIPPASSPNQPLPTGPMSTNVKIPPRPKPGRKPIPQEDAADRRRLQNRIAQRNFRDKRQQKLAETQVELEEKKQEYQGHINEHQRHIDKLCKEQNRLREANERLRKRVDELERSNSDMAERLEDYEGTRMRGNPLALSGGVFALPSSRSRKQPRTTGPTFRDPAALTPPDETSTGETDFTNYGRGNQRGSQNLRPSLSNDSNIGFSMDISTNDDSCGFCTDSQNCLCKQEETPTEPLSQQGPGNCNACLRDPNRAAACRQMASAAQPHLSEAQTTISCEDFMNRASQSGQHIANIPGLLGNQVYAFPGANGRYEIDEQQAAQALQKLSRRGPGNEQ